MDPTVRRQRDALYRGLAPSAPGCRRTTGRPVLWLFRLLAAAAPASLGPAVAVAADLEDVAVMHQPVHRRNGHVAAGEDLIPGREHLVGGDQQRETLVAVADQFKQHAAFLPIPPHTAVALGFCEAVVIDQQQRIPVQPLQRLRQPVVGGAFCSFCTSVVPRISGRSSGSTKSSGGRRKPWRRLQHC